MLTRRELLRVRGGASFRGPGHDADRIDRFARGLRSPPFLANTSRGEMPVFERAGIHLRNPAVSPIGWMAATFSGGRRSTEEMGEAEITVRRAVADR